MLVFFSQLSERVQGFAPTYSVLRYSPEAKPNVAFLSPRGGDMAWYDDIGVWRKRNTHAVDGHVHHPRNMQESRLSFDTN